MSASTDTSIHIWDLKGEVLASINTNQMTNSYAAISPCGRSVWQRAGLLQLAVLFMLGDHLKVYK